MAKYEFGQFNNIGPTVIGDGAIASDMRCPACGNNSSWTDHNIDRKRGREIATCGGCGRRVYHSGGSSMNR